MRNRLDVGTVDKTAYRKVPVLYCFVSGMRFQVRDHFDVRTADVASSGGSR